MDRTRQILDSAAELFLERGFHGVGVDELGRRAGLSGPSLYRHFSGKDEILAALFTEAIDELLSATSPVHDDPAADLERLLRHHVQFAITHRTLVNVYQREDRSLVDPWRATFARRQERYVAGWERTVSRAFPSARAADVAVATQACLGMVFSVAYWPSKTAHRPGACDLAVRLATHGLGCLR